MRTGSQVRNGLRDRVAIKAMARTPVAGGGFTEGFSSTLSTVWAEITEDEADERTSGSQVEHARRYTVKIRFLSTVTAAMRITWGSRTLKILGLRDAFEARKRYLLIRCEECPA